jgi:hypothetical protein
MDCPNCLKEVSQKVSNCPNCGLSRKEFPKVWEDELRQILLKEVTSNRAFESRYVCCTLEEKRRELEESRPHKGPVNPQSEAQVGDGYGRPKRRPESNEANKGLDEESLMPGGSSIFRSFTGHMVMTEEDHERQSLLLDKAPPSLIRLLDAEAKARKGLSGWPWFLSRLCLVVLVLGGFYSLKHCSNGKF